VTIVPVRSPITTAIIIVAAAGAAGLILQGTSS
jgi:hypothetical protein